jgi:hypothetical protein
MGGQSLGYLEQKISSTVNETRGGATAFKAYQTSLAQPALDCPRPPAPLSARLLVWVLQPAPCCCCCCCCCCRPRSQSAPSGRTVSYPSPSGASTIILPTPAEHWRISRLAGLTRDGKPAHVQRIHPWRRRRRVLNSAVCDAAVSLPDMLQWVGSAVVQRVANRPMRTWMSIFDHQARCAIHPITHHPSPAHLYHQRHNTNITSRLAKSNPNMHVLHIHYLPRLVITAPLNPPPRALAPPSSCSKSKVTNTTHHAQITQSGTNQNRRSDDPYLTCYYLPIHRSLTTQSDI